MPPRPLPENAGLAFTGEHIAPGARLTEAAAQRLLSARNPNGRPNADVVRRFAASERGHLLEYWVVDFPPDMAPQEAGLYVEPFRRAAHPAEKNRNLRNALARRERYLAMPAAAGLPEWLWLDASIIPDDSLVVVARDDDFTHGILSARPFALWWQRYRSSGEPVLAVASYPFPWPPGMGLSSLSKTQEEQRYGVARAARNPDTATLNTAVAAAYGWPADLDDKELLTRLGELNRTRDN